jgi:hypothetical protein
VSVVQQRIEIYESFLFATRGIQGGSPQVSWLKDGSFFFFSADGTQLFVDPKIGKPRLASEKDRANAIRETSTTKWGRVYAPGAGHYAKLENGQIQFAGGELGKEKSQSKNAKEDAHEGVFCVARHAHRSGNIPCGCGGRAG